MAHRRNHGGPKTSSPLDDHRSPPAATAGGGAAGDEGSSLAAQAILASSAHRDSSLSSVYGESAIASSARRESNRHRPPPPHRTAAAYEYTSIENLNESKSGFWRILARKAKSLIDDESATQQFENHGRTHSQMADTSKHDQARQSYLSPEGFRKSETPSPQRADTLASSLNYIGGTIKNALGEGLTIVENRTADIIQETRKLRVRRKGSPNTQNQAIHIFSQHGLPQNQTDLETQLKASRDVANAMSAKAKLLLRELKTVKADLAFAKERCAQLEEENKILRESYENGSNPEDDDLIRLQLETLLAEKGRLAHENSVYARENRFLREIVEYHQLTMQDLVYVDEGIEEVAEVSPIHIPPLSSPSRAAPPSPITPNPRPSTNPTAYTPSSLPTSTSTVSDVSPFIPTTPTLSPSKAFSETASPNPTRQPDPSDSSISR